MKNHNHFCKVWGRNKSKQIWLLNRLPEGRILYLKRRADFAYQPQLLRRIRETDKAYSSSFNRKKCSEFEGEIN